MKSLCKVKKIQLQLFPLVHGQSHYRKYSYRVHIRKLGISIHYFAHNLLNWFI